MDIWRFFCILHTVFDNQEYNTRRAGGAGLWIESHKRSEAETRKKPQEVLTDIYYWNPFHLWNGGCQLEVCKILI